MSGFNNQEIEAIQEFRRRVADVLPEDEFSKRSDSLIRWIRARELDLGKAEEMFRHSMQWRIDNKIDRLISSEIDTVLFDKFPYYMDGVDKRGRPVVTMPFGMWDVKGFIEDGGAEQFVEYTNQMLERIVAALKRCTYEIEKAGGTDESLCVQCVMISNMEGYAFRQLTNMKAVHSLIQMVSVFEAHYPETMGQCLVINAPSVFSILFGLIKPFMSQYTVQKIKIHSSVKEQWHPEVLELIDPSQIREEFGGTKI